MRKSRVALAVVALPLLSMLWVPIGNAQDSTGVKLSPVPTHLPAKEQRRLEQQRALVQTAIDSMNAARKRFNSRCARITDAGTMASCQSEMNELEAGGKELEQFKVQHNTSVASAVAVNPAPLPAAPRERVATAGSPSTQEKQVSRRPAAKKPGGGSALDALRSADASGGKAKGSGDFGKDPAMDVFDRAGEKVEGVAVVRFGDRQPLRIPDKLKTDPAYMKLAREEQKLAADHVKLQARLDGIRKQKQTGAEEYAARRDLFENEKKQTDNRFAQEEMVRKVNRGVDFGGASSKPPKKGPPSPPPSKTP